MTVGKNIISRHIFLFPFRWDQDENTDNIQKKLKENNWQLKDFSIDKPTDYNQQVYFYKHISDVIYSKDKKDLLVCYEYQGEIGNYKIKIKNDKIKDDKIYSLVIDDISLKLYKKCRIGILSLKLKNLEYKDQKDILKINDFGRRIYPQYLPLYLKEKEKKAIGAKANFLADSITIEKLNNGKKNDSVEDFEDKYNLEAIKKRTNENENLFILPDFINHLIDSVFECPKKIESVIDDRMYTLCWYGNNKTFTSVKRDLKKKKQSTKQNFWYEYIFVDGKGCMCQSSSMVQKLISEHTYDRWLEWGTLYGICRYSFMVLTTENPPEYITTHLETMYYEMVMLCLLQRSAIITFRERIHKLLSSENKDYNSIINLYEEYLEFKNKIYAREVTAQEQGIELYDMMQSTMKIDVEVEALDKDISELYSFIRVSGLDKGSRQMENINKIAVVFAPLAIALGFFALATFPCNSFLNKFSFWMLCILIVILTSLLILKITIPSKLDKMSKPIIFITLIGFAIAFIFFIFKLYII